MQKLYFFLFFLFFQLNFAQIKHPDATGISENGMFENASGKKITDPQEKLNFLKQREEKITLEKKHMHKATQNAVEMCTNGGFEQTVNVAGSNFIKNFLYNVGDPPGPTQCKSISNTGDTYIPQYDPASNYVMATSVPANLIDPYMGDIKGFDQYALKLNYQGSSTYGGITQGKRFKTNNENFLKFNYKAVLQSVYDTSHTDNQAFFKARILNKNNEVVSEFCLVGDEKNCIFTKVAEGGYGYVTLYTANWQSGVLDISSIPNNEEFTVEFMASRCGLGGHFGYAYVDDLCLLHSDENFVGSVNLDPLFAVCPTLPLSVCGTYTLPNSGGITANLKGLTLKVYNELGNVVYTTTTTSSLDVVNKKFCFSLLPQNLPDITASNYNVGVTAQFEVAGNPGGCGSGGNNSVFASANDPDANDGWDISFLNCSSGCNLSVNTAKISKCDTNKDGFEDFDLTSFNSQIVSSTAGLTFSYFKDYTSAFNNTNAIANFSTYNSASAIIYIKVYRDANCYKIIPVNVEVKNPTATISGILNVCSGSTELTASSGATYIWSTGESSQKITVTNTGIYTVTVTDSFGCASVATVTIEASQTAVTPTLEITQPSCFVPTGTIKVISPASEYSFDNGATWVLNPVKRGLYPGNYKILIKTIKGCTSYAQAVTIVASLTAYPNYNVEQPKFCGDTGKITISSSAAFYSFDNGMTWVNSATADLLQPGIYTIRTRDVTGCISNPAVVVIVSNTLGLPDFTVKNPACSVRGSITINTPSDYYTFNGGQTWVTSNVLSNISSGNYSVGIKNNLGCTSYFQSVYIQNFQNTSPEYDLIQPTCGEKGTIFIKTEADFYSFDGGANWTTSNTKDLFAGQYNLKIKNSAGCQSSSSNVILYPPTLDSPFLTTIQPTCGNPGQITINTVSDFYSFDNGATWVTTNSKILPAGNYQILIKNNLGCVSYPQGVYLTEVKLPVPVVTTIQPTCTTKGTITIDTPASFYSINGGATWVTTNIFSNLGSSSYIVMIKNSQNCVSETNYVYFNQIALDAPTYTITNPSCGNIGNITFTSTADYYSIDGGTTWVTNPVFNNLGTGSYTILVKNNSNCRSNGISVYMNTTDLANPTVIVTQPTCGTKGSITVTTPATSYSFDSGYTWASTPTLNNLSSGYFNVKVKTGSCTSNSTSVVINEFLLPNPAFTSTQPTCGVGGNISFTTVAAQYSINNGQTWSTSPNFTNLADGYYNLMIQNAQGCKSSSYGISVNMTKFYLPKPDVLIVQPTCGMKGSIKIMTPASMYSFDGGQTWSTVNEKTNLTSGYFNIVIKNAQSCTSNPYELSVNIKTFYLPNPLVKTVHPTCANNGSITVVSQSAEYSFDNGSTWGTSPVLLKPTPGYYNILIKNSAGCVSRATSVNINKFYLNQPSVTTIQPTCSAPKGSIFINTVADLYSFDNGTTWTSNPVKNNLNSGSYYIVIKNSFGCVSQSAYTNIYNAPSSPAIPTFTSVQPSSCAATDGTITITTAASSYTFNDGATWTTNPVKKNVGAGTYIIRIKTNSSTCESASVAVTLNSGVNIAAPAIVVTQPTCSVSTGSVTVTTSAATYSFDDGLTFVYADTKNGLTPGTYKIKIKNTAGCISDAILATVTNPAPLPAPNSTISQPDCTNSLGSIQITTTAAEYSFDNGLTFGNSSIKNNAGPGTYNLMIKDAAGCISLAGTATVNVQPITPGAPQISITQPSGCIASTGNIAVISAAGFYSFDDGITWITAASQNLSPGTYQIKIKLTATGCSSPATSATVNVPPNAPLLPVASVIQPNSCITPFGSITISSTEAEFSFDNGVTYSPNSTSGQLPPGIYLLKVKNSAGCESGATSVVINIPADTPVKPSATVQQIDCAHQSAVIKIIANAAEFSIDDGMSWQTSNTFSGLLPKTYLIKIKNSLGCVSDSNPVIVNTFTNPTAKPLADGTQKFCVQQNATLNNIIATGNDKLWYAVPVGGSAIPVTTSLINGTTYYVTQTLNSCESERLPVTAIIISTIPPTGNTAPIFCISQNATLGDIILNGNQIKWYSSASATVSLPNTNLLQNGITYYATQTEQNCESVQRLPVTISLVTTNIPAADFTVSPLCSDENGTKKIDLTRYQSDLVTNSTIYSYSYFDENNQVIPNSTNHTLQTGNNAVYVEIKAASGCRARVKLNFQLNASPVVNVPATAVYCPDDFLSLDAGIHPGIKSYNWTFNGAFYSSDQIIKVNKDGTYEITVSNVLGCSTTKTVLVKKVETPLIINIKIENNTVRIIATGNGVLEYSVDGTTWQSSEVFYNLAEGNYTAYVRSTSQVCAVAERFFTIFKIKNVFTPNNDGINDEWKIEGIERYPGSKIKVLDRFGKIVLDRTVTGNFSWNGEFLSRKLPTGSYWYQIIVSDGRMLSGFVVIKNRD